ncbi:MAG: phosphatase PAP2 family protein [Deinococcota bacterium]|nr:phosphatase PAP2 family protein [Deinococcota bacterium]
MKPRAHSAVFLAVSFSLLFATFVALAVAAHSPLLLQLDVSVSRWVQGFRSGWLDGVATAVTLLGNTLPLIVFGIVAAALLFRSGHWWAAGLSAAIAPLTLSLNGLLKALVGRPRPDEGLVYVLLSPAGLGFPSGHALVPTVFYGFLALLVGRLLPPGRGRRLAVILLAAVPVATGLSRVYLGVHWFSDVLAGWAGGLLLLLLLALLYHRVAPAEVSGLQKRAP